MTLSEFIRVSVYRAASRGPDRWFAVQPQIDALYRWTSRHKDKR